MVRILRVRREISVRPSAALGVTYELPFNTASSASISSEAAASFRRNAEAPQRKASPTR